MTEVIVLTGFPAGFERVGSTVSAMRQEAFTVLEKPFKVDQLCGRRCATPRSGCGSSGRTASTNGGWRSGSASAAWSARAARWSG